MSCEECTYSPKTYEEYCISQSNPSMFCSDAYTERAHLCNNYHAKKLAKWDEKEMERKEERKGMDNYIMNRESLKRHCKAMCYKYKDIPTSGTYGEHRFVLDLLEQTEETRNDIKSVLEDIKADIKEWYWQADKQVIAKDPCVVDSMIDLFIRTIEKKESEI